DPPNGRRCARPSPGQARPRSGAAVPGPLPAPDRPRPGSPRSHTRADLKPGPVRIRTSAIAAGCGCPSLEAGSKHAPALPGVDRIVDVAGWHLTQCIDRQALAGSSINCPITTLGTALTLALGMEWHRGPGVRLRGRAWLLDRLNGFRFILDRSQHYSAPRARGRNVILRGSHA